MKTRKVIVLGATGSIGRQAIDCIQTANRKDPGSFEVVGLSAHRDKEGLEAAGRLFPGARLVLSGADPESLNALLRDSEADLALNGIAGADGLKASAAALESGKNLALANKESVVMGFRLLKSLADKKALAILPVDSEHAALFQLISRVGAASVRELIITASGGPFRDKSAAELKTIRPDEAARHPVWKMGRKISIDSATLANKGLELIEAARLFGFPSEKLRVLIHPESLAHALVRAQDGALYAHMSSPDMRLPINAALYWPMEADTPYGLLDLAGKTLSFEEPDTRRFPMLALAAEALRLGEAAAIAYNAADEIAVAAFEAGSLGFTQIADLVAKVLEAPWDFPVTDIGSIFDIDARARGLARRIVTELQC